MAVGAGSIHTELCFDFLLGMILCDPGLGPNVSPFQLGYSMTLESPVSSNTAF